MLLAQERKDENKQQSLAVTTQNPVKWQPATENISYLIQKPARGQSLSIMFNSENRKTSCLHSLGEKASLKVQTGQTN